MGSVANIIFILLYTIAFVSFIGYHLFSYISFSKMIKKKNANLMIEPTYQKIIVLIGVLFLCLYILSVVYNFIYRDFEIIKQIPVVIFLLPLTGFVFYTIVKETMFAYSEQEIFIGTKMTANIDEIKMKDIYKKNSFLKSSISFSYYNYKKGKEESCIIHTSIYYALIFERLVLLTYRGEVNKSKN